jgi:hypothetical protein
LRKTSKTWIRRSKKYSTIVKWSLKPYNRRKNLPLTNS